MPKTWLTADPHFGHQGVCVFTRADGSKLRPWDNAEEMDEALIERWNSVVKPEDRIYVLGDLAMKPKAMHAVMPRLLGRKVLIKGNHDIFKMKEYAQYFDDIRAYSILDGTILSHIPIHEGSLGRFGCNIHGHTHAHRVTRERVLEKTGDLYAVENMLDPRYFCVSVEHTDFTPITFDEVKLRIEAEGGSTSFKSREAVYGAAGPD